MEYEKVTLWKSEIDTLNAQIDDKDTQISKLKIHLAHFEDNMHRDLNEISRKKDYEILQLESRLK